MKNQKIIKLLYKINRFKIQIKANNIIINFYNFYD
jgi:competence protein ComGF